MVFGHKMHIIWRRTKQQTIKKNNKQKMGELVGKKLEKGNAEVK
jgi:hypothetical protein